MCTEVGRFAARFLLAVSVYLVCSSFVAQEPAAGLSETDLLLQRGLLALLEGDLDAAESSLLEAYETSPDDIGTLLGLSQLNEERGDLEKALGFARRAEEIRPGACRSRRRPPPARRDGWHSRG